VTRRSAQPAQLAAPEPELPRSEARPPRLTASGIGQCCLDYLITVDRFPVPDSKQEFLDLAVQGGGPVATALVLLARWGVKTRFSGVVGGDPFGRDILEGLNGESIDTTCLQVRREGRSQFAVICVERESGRRTIFWGRPQGPELQPGEVSDGFLHGAQALHLDGSFAETALDLARKARSAGVPVILDAGSSKPGMWELIRCTDHLIASETFARQVSQGRPLERLLPELRDMGPQIVTVTLGERGSVSLWEDRPMALPALRVPVRDTTGAGDVFHGAYVFGLLRGWPPEERLRWATVAASLSCRAVGGRAGIPDPGVVADRLPDLGPFRSWSGPGGRT